MKVIHWLQNILPKKVVEEKLPQNTNDSMRKSVLALDIGTAYVKALVCSVDYIQGKVIVRGVGKQRQRLGDMYNGGIIDIQNVLDNIRLAVTEAETMAGIKSGYVVLGMAGELVKGTTTNVEYLREDPRVAITLSELRHLTQKVQWKAYREARGEISKETGHGEVEIKLVHTSLVDIRIDGYRVSNPIGFKGKHVRLNIFNAFAPLVHFESLRSIARALDKELLAIIVEPYAVSRSMEEEDGGDVSALFVDIGGGSTDVALVHNGGVVGTKMFGMGGRMFTKRIAKGLHVPFSEAEKIKVDYGKGELTGEINEKVKEIVAEDVKTWADALAMALQEIHKEGLPARIYLCGGGALLKDIGKYLESEPWSQQLPFLRSPSIAHLMPSHISRVQDATGILISEQDITPMGLANIAYELAGEEKLLSRILRQVSQVIST